MGATATDATGVNPKGLEMCLRCNNRVALVRTGLCLECGKLSLQEFAAAEQDRNAQRDPEDVMRAAGVNLAGYGHCTFSNFVAAEDYTALEATTEFLSRVGGGDPTGMYLHAKRSPQGFLSTGQGKSHLAHAAMRDLASTNTPAQFRVIYSAMWMLEMQDTFNTRKSTMALLDRATEPDVLFLEDLGVEQCSAWTMRMLYALFEARTGRPTFITGNLPLAEWYDRADADLKPMAQRVADRIKGACIEVPMVGPNRRGMNETNT